MPRVRQTVTGLAWQGRAMFSGKDSKAWGVFEDAKSLPFEYVVKPAKIHFSDCFKKLPNDICCFSGLTPSTHICAKTNLRNDICCFLCGFFRSNRGHAACKSYSSVGLSPNSARSLDFAGHSFVRFPKSRSNRGHARA